ncbi:MAG TPA: hypothetical protein VME68_00030 [Acidobacteriaceae bacterium]|nr:hypothetical protein [Acidobacteriaceae bacterium]
MQAHAPARGHRAIRVLLTLCLVLFSSSLPGAAQNTPLLSGGVGFFSSTFGGATTYYPIIEPLAALPLGQHFFVESRATLLETYSPSGNSTQGYQHSHFIGLTYLQGAAIANSHLTVIGGSFLLPFGTYNERLSPVWIGNFQDGPLIASLGVFGSGSGLGGQLRGSAISRARYSLDYVAYFSARSNNTQFNADRSSGGRVDLYLPEQRLEIGASYVRLLQGTHENFSGMHVWWEPKDANFRLRSEFARGQHAIGYWSEADYRLGGDSFWGRFEPLFRLQQTFRLNQNGGDSVPLVNTQRADFGLDYNLPHNVRILTSYARQFSSTENANVWETGIVYRFLFPAWKGKGL